MRDEPGFRSMTVRRSGADAANPHGPSYTNPIFDHDFPDPAVIRAPDGFYYAYATQTQRQGKWINIQVARSTNLIDWEYIGDALPEKPDWAAETQDFWAPSVIYDGSTYYMYYSATPTCATIISAGMRLPSRRRIRRQVPSSTWGCRSSLAQDSNLSIPTRSTIQLRAGTFFTGDRASSRSGSRSSRRTACPSRPEALPRRSHLAERRKGELPAPRRGSLGDPSRQPFLSLLFRRQLLRRRRGIWSDGRSLR